MVLGRDDNALCTRRFCNAAPLVTIKIRGIKYFLMLGSFSPFLIGESIGTKMQEEVELHSMPLQLRPGWLGNRVIALSKANTVTKKNASK